jgi:hypothetical protein
MRILVLRTRGDPFAKKDRLNDVLKSMDTHAAVTSHRRLHDELLNGALSSFLCVAIGIYSIASEKTGCKSSSLISAPVCGVFGGYLRVRQRVRAVAA